MKQSFIRQGIIAGLSLLLLSLLSFLVVNAQNKKDTPTDLIGFQIEVMQEKLGLNGGQVDKLTAFHAEEKGKLKNASEEEAKKIIAARDAGYKEILTADQFSKWQKQKSDILDEAQFRYLTSDAYSRDFKDDIKKGK